MDHNPYSPPQTEVLEAPSDDNSPRPRQVKLAVRLFWVEFAVALMQFVTALPSTTKGRDPAAVTIYVAVLGMEFAAEAIVIYKLWVRRNWARYVALISSVLGLLEFAQAIGRGRLTSGSGELGMEAVELMLDAVALFLLFTSPGKEWFKKPQAG